VSQSFPLRGEVSLGRDKSNGVVVSDQKVSRHHASLTPIGDAFIVADRGSANGTYLNGILLTQPTRLKDMDRITVGDTQFLFNTSAASPHAAIGPQPASAVPISLARSPTQDAPSLLPSINDRSIWLVVGCLALVIVGLLLMLAVLLGVYLGSGQVVGVVSLIR
jgi:predicted component of type VI protein secretion system